MEIRVLTESDLKAALDMPAAIRAMDLAFRQLSGGGASVPVRSRVEGEGVTLLTMPGRLEDPPALGAKLVTVVPGNRGRGHPAIHAAVLLLDPVTGIPRALLDGEWLTALRTGAGSGLATDLLADPGAAVLAVLGAGAQARTQVEAVLSVRPVREVRIHSRTPASARAFARELEAGGRVERVRVPGSSREATRGASVVCTATDAVEPVVEAAALDPGVHINAVGGYRRDMQEIPGEVMARARVVVDQREAALREAGDVIIPLEAGLIRRDELVELGEVAAGSAPGRRSRDEITLFKSVGNAAQDLAVAVAALAAAEARGLGTLVRG